MVLGFFLGTTVGQLKRTAARIERLAETLDSRKEQAIADRQAAIRAAQEDIDTIRGL